MKKISLGFLALALALAITPVASADTVTFDMTFSGVGTAQFGAATGSGVLIGVSNGLGGYTIESGSGTMNFGGIISNFTVEAPDTSIGYLSSGHFDLQMSSDGTADNTINLIAGSNGLYTIQSSNPGAGLGMYLGSTDPLEVEFEGSTSPGGGGAYFADADAAGQGDFGTATTLIISSTPEPSSLLLLGTGLLGLAFVAFRKAKPSGLTLNR
jgi:hypothetical protein